VILIWERLRAYGFYRQGAKEALRTQIADQAGGMRNCECVCGARLKALRTDSF